MPVPPKQNHLRDLSSQFFSILLLLQPKPDPAQSDSSNVDATITLRDVDIAKFIEQLEIKLPYKISGKATVQAKFGVPLDQVATRSSYRLKGTLTSPELQFEGLTVRDLKTELIYRDGKLSLTNLSAKIPQADDPKGAPGTFRGSADAAIDPAGAVSATLDLDRIALSSVVAAIPKNRFSASGFVSGHAEFHAPFDKIEQMETWTGSASLRGDTLTVAGRTITGFTFDASLAKGIATLTKAAVTVEGIPIAASGTLTLRDKYPFEAVVKTSGTNLADFRKLVPEANLPLPVEGRLDLETRASGTLSPFTFKVSGKITADKLTLAKAAANHVDVTWELTPQELKISELKARVFGGNIDGSLDYPLDAAKAGDFQVTFKDVDAGAAAAFVPNSPVKITGAISGKVSGAIAPARSGTGRIGDLDIDLTAPKLTVQNIPAERLVGKAAIKQGAIQYSLEGKTLGGSFEVKGRYPGAGKPKAPADKDRGSLRINDIDLSRLAGALGSQSLKPLAGKVDVAFDYANDLSSGSGRVLIRDLSWGRQTASPEIVGVLILNDHLLELRELSGTIAHGLLRGSGRFNLDQPARNYFSLALDRADAARLLAPIPQAAGAVSGQVSLAVRGTIGRSIHGSGSVTLPRGSLGGADVSELRVPFDYSVAPGRSRITIRDATSLAGTGRIQSNLELNVTETMRLAGQIRMIDTPIRALSPSLGSNSLVGNGRITGRLDLAGSEMRSLDDLNGVLIATLSNTSVKEIPLLQQTIPYLNTIGLAKPFQSGDIRGTLSRGIFRIQRLALANPSAQFFADGTITLQNSRIDLNVVAHTGNVGPQAAGFRLLVSKLPLFGPVPISVIRDVSDLLTNRTVRLSVTGTVSNPVVRVNAGELLTQEAVRFFLTKYVVPADAATALGLGSVGNLSK